MVTIYDLYSIFRNPCGEKRWQVWDGDSLIGLFHTRRDARACRMERIQERKART